MKFGYLDARWKEVLGQEDKIGKLPPGDVRAEIVARMEEVRGMFSHVHSEMKKGEANKDVWERLLYDLEDEVDRLVKDVKRHSKPKDYE